MTTTSMLQTLLWIEFPSLQSARCIANHSEPVTQATDSEIAQSWISSSADSSCLLCFALRCGTGQTRRIRRRERCWCTTRSRHKEPSEPMSSRGKCQHLFAAKTHHDVKSLLPVLLLFFPSSFFFSTCACTSTDPFSSFVVLINLLYPTHFFFPRLSRLFFRGSSFSGIVSVTPLPTTHHQESALHCIRSTLYLTLSHPSSFISATVRSTVDQPTLFLSTVFRVETARQHLPRLQSFQVAQPY